MTSFFQAIARQPSLSFSGCLAAFTGTSRDDEAEYHVVFATTAAALAAGGAVVFAALSHAF